MTKRMQTIPIIQKKNMEVFNDMESYHDTDDKIIYFICKIASTCSNQVQEFARNMKNPGNLHWKCLECKNVTGNLITIE